MFGLRRFAVIESQLALRSRAVSMKNFHSASALRFPIPASTDSANKMSSTNTAGQGPNEPGNPKHIKSGSTTNSPTYKSVKDMQNDLNKTPKKSPSTTNTTSAAAAASSSSMKNSGSNDGMMAQASEAMKSGASTVKETLSSAMSAMKDATSTMTDKMSESKENMANKANSFGERMEKKLETMGDNMMKSGEEIERRNQDPKDPYPEPNKWSKERPHEPNPENLNDVLPGTGIKDQQKNTPITDSTGRGQFPG